MNTLLIWACWYTLLYLQNNLISKSSFYGLGYECVFNKDKGILKKLKYSSCFHENNLIKNLYTLERTG